MQMNFRKIPTARMLLAVSYGCVFAGILLGGYFIFFAPSANKNAFQGLAVMSAGIITGALLRALAVMAQLLFETKGIIAEGIIGQTAALENMRDSLGESLRSLHADIAAHHEHTLKTLQTSNTDSQQLKRQIAEKLEDIKIAMTRFGCDIKDIKTEISRSGCDVKDITEYLHQLKNFFEQIERHLDLQE